MQGLGVRFGAFFLFLLVEVLARAANPPKALSWHKPALCKLAVTALDTYMI